MIDKAEQQQQEWPSMQRKDFVCREIFEELNKFEKRIKYFIQSKRNFTRQTRISIDPIANIWTEENYHKVQHDTVQGNSLKIRWIERNEINSHGERPHAITLDESLSNVDHYVKRKFTQAESALAL